MCLQRVNTDMAGTNGCVRGVGDSVSETGIGRRLYLIKEDTGSSARAEVG